MPRILLTALCCSLSFIAFSSQLLADDASRVPRIAELLKTAKRPVKVVCFGDSVTGLYYHTGGRRAYTEMVAIALKKGYPQAEITAINAGISGHTTQQGLARIEKDVLAHKPDLVTVMFGLNDMVRGPLDGYRKNLTEIIRRCRAIGAEVLLCTPNSVINTASRPITKLEKYVAVVHEVGKSEQVAVVDCYAAYEAVRAKDAMTWSLLMSDAIHPNMDGHKLIAEEIAAAVLGRRVSLGDVAPAGPPLERVMQRLKKGQPVKILAMPPYAEYFRDAFRKLAPDAKLDIATWETAGKTLAEIEAAAKNVRAMKLDLVVIAVPASAEAKSTEHSIRSFSWVLNRSLSFGYREWDCIGIPPGVAERHLLGTARDQLIRRLIRAQDLPLIDVGTDKEIPARALVENWLRLQLQNSTNDR